MNLLRRLMQKTKKAGRESSSLPSVFTKIPGCQPIELVAYYESFLQYYPDCEPNVKRWFARNVRSDWIIMDCGANIGYYTILFSRLAPDGHVHAFEPTTTYDMLQENLSHHAVTNVTAKRIAMGKESGEIEENIYRVWGNPPEKLRYAFSTVDDYVRSEGLSRVDCIKIDVDSYDFDVLRGATHTLEAFNPFVVVELNHALNLREQSNIEALSWLSRMGYKDVIALDHENFLIKRDVSAGEMLELSHRVTIHFSELAPCCDELGAAVCEKQKPSVSAIVNETAS